MYTKSSSQEIDSEAVNIFKCNFILNINYSMYHIYVQ